ncbi:probable serine/threonine-protein kinase At1g54610 [Gastrolobium bilobum]|uniref:probable serine/threonine-protein kinase At1g54610 n=1 Tax=Gastrolobium bilobum TaxID=150636 RepID=UPI002AB10A84|nr:probable serine/threonine-protein kinase At1g54610 [Gastrolobium bilobum]
MGCVQAKPLEASDYNGLERLKLDNGYVKSDDFVAHRRSTGRRHEPVESHREPTKHKVESRVGNGERQGLELVGGHKEVLVSKTRDADVHESKKLPKKCFEDDMVDGWPRWLVDNVPRQVLADLVPKSAESYKMIDKVGQGTYSNVYKALDRDTGEIVALKKVRFNTSEPESIKFMAREIMILQNLDHPNVIKLKGLATSRMQYSIYLVFDFMQTDLARIIAPKEERLTEPQVKCYMHQLLSGLQHCHDRGILHRDIKGSNLLIDKNGMLKIGDFGLANYYSPNHNQPLTSRVVTLWYRAPELLLGATDYGVGIDLWSAGCLLAEMFTGIPIMPGRTEVEQLHRIFRLCGTPSEEYWRKFRLSTTSRPPKSYRPSLVETFRDLPPSSLGLLCTLLALDPAFRGSASKALKNQFFFTSPLACELSGLPVIYSEDDKLLQANEQIKYMNSKIRRSRTYLERRKNLASKRPIEHTVSSKEELRRNAEPETYVLNEELESTTTSSTSSSVNQAGAKDHSPFFSSPLLSSDQKLSPKFHHHANVGEKNIKNLPQLPKSKPNATKKYDSRYRPDQVFRSASTREFRNSKREEHLLFEIDD